MVHLSSVIRNIVIIFSKSAGCYHDELENLPRVSRTLQLNSNVPIINARYIENLRFFPDRFWMVKFHVMERGH